MSGKIYMIGGGVILVMTLLIYILDLRLSIEKKARKIAEASYAQCIDDQKLTQEVSDAYQTKITDLDNELRDLKRMRDEHAGCIPVTKPAEQCNDATIGSELTKTHGLSTDWLYDFAAEGERYRLQLIACQGFITKTWKRSAINDKSVRR